MDASQIRSLIAEAFNVGREVGRREGATAGQVLQQLTEKAAQLFEVNEVPSEAKARPDRHVQHAAMVEKLEKVDLEREAKEALAQRRQKSDG